MNLNEQNQSKHVLLISYCSNLLIEMYIMTDTYFIFCCFISVQKNIMCGGFFCIVVTVLCLDYILILLSIAVSLEIFLIFW